MISYIGRRIALHSGRLSIDNSWRQVLVGHCGIVTRFRRGHYVLFLVDHDSTDAIRHVAGQVLSLIVFPKRTLLGSGCHISKSRVDLHLLAESVDLLAAINIVGTQGISLLLSDI